MSNPFIAEIRIFAGNFAPRGWALCNGQLLPISQNTALFSLLGTTYGKVQFRPAQSPRLFADASRPGAGSLAP
jgi:microcystin-dependent protein